MTDANAAAAAGYGLTVEVMGGKLDIGPLMIDAELAALSPAAHCPTVALF